MSAAVTVQHATTFEFPLLETKRIGRDVLHLSLDGAANPMPYREGQFVALELPGGHVRSYSLAQPCSADGRLEMHIRLRPDGMMAKWLDSSPVPGVRLRVHGPYGDCVWQTAESADAIIMLATGTGIAPLHAMLLRELAGSGDAPIWLYWGARDREDLYLIEHLSHIAATTPRFHFIPVLSRADANWTGARGHVQQLAAQQHPDLRHGRVYACGTSAMVDDARALLSSQCGLPLQHFLADAFEPAVHAAETPTSPVHIELDLHDGSRQTLHCAAGESLYQGLKSANLIQGVCGGHLSCGTCKVHPDPAWQSKIPVASRAEKRLLAVLEQVADGDRLACQIGLTADLSGLTIKLSAPAWLATT